MQSLGELQSSWSFTAIGSKLILRGFAGVKHRYFASFSLRHRGSNSTARSPFTIATGSRSLADAIPFLFAGDMESIGLRRLVAELAMAYHYVTAGKLMKRCFQMRARIGDDFSRLKNLIAIWAAIREVHRVTHGGNSIWDTPHVPFNIGAWYERLVRAFVTKQLPSRPIPWQRLAHQADEHIVRMVRNDYRKAHGKPRPADADRRCLAGFAGCRALTHICCDMPLHGFHGSTKPGMTTNERRGSRFLRRSWALFSERLARAEDARADKDSDFAPHTPNDWDR